MNRAPACPACQPYGVDGWLPVVVKAGPSDANPYDYDLTTWRPCQSCRPKQWHRWRYGSGSQGEEEAS